MNRTGDNEELRVLADDYTQHLNELLGLLQLEYEALNNREFENIRACTERKEVILAKLEKLESQRLIVEQQAQTGAGLRTRFNEKIATLLQRCSAMNMVNGGIVEISKQFNQRMLNTILGMSAQDDNLYDAAGNNSGSKLKQIFAKI